MHDTLIELATRDGICVIKVGSEIDIANAGTLARYIDEACAGAEKVIVSLEPCRYIDSSGLRHLIRLAARLGEDLFLVVPPGAQIRRIFELTGMTEYMRVCDTLAEAELAARRKVEAL